MLIVVVRRHGRVRTLLRLRHGACRLGHGGQLLDTTISALPLHENLRVPLIRFVSSAWSSSSPCVLMDVEGAFTKIEITGQSAAFLLEGHA